MIHVTLNTGHARESHADEVGADIAEAVREMLTRALEARGRAVPMTPPGYSLTAAVEGDALIVTVWRGHREFPIATVGVATAEGAELWRVLHSGAADLVTAGQSPPVEPWCASRLDVGIALDPGAAEWLGDFGRCVAWTWVRWRQGGA